MKKILLALVLCGSLQTVFAQGFSFGLKIAPAANVASVNDKDGRSSFEYYPADGYTEREKSAGCIGVDLMAEYFFSKNIAFSSGFYFTQKNLDIRNSDGGYFGPLYYDYYRDFYNYRGYNPHDYYSGTSRYNVSYLQIPLLLKYVSNDLVDKLKIYINIGPTIDFKMSEKLDEKPPRGDYAHFWNMAKQRPYYDPHRGRNAYRRPVALFNPIDVTLYFSGGVTYEIIDNLDLFGGLVLNKGFVNMINPKLRFDEPYQTKVGSLLSIKSFLIGAEFGVSYSLSK